MILNSFFKTFNNYHHIGEDLLRVLIFPPKLLEIGKKLIFSLNEVEKQIKVVLANGSEIRCVARDELDHEFMDRVDFLRILPLFFRVSEGLNKLITQSKSNWYTYVDVHLHFINDLPAKLAIWHSFVGDEISSAKNDFDVLPQKRVVVFFHDLQADVDDLLQLLAAHVLKTGIR